MPSIDNYYLLLTLMHGFVSLFFLLAILLTSIVRLMMRGMAHPPPALPGSDLAFTLAGIQVAILITIATVFMGGQVVPIFALITGWAEGFLIGRPNQNALTPTSNVVVLTARPYRFARVVA